MSDDPHEAVVESEVPDVVADPEVATVMNLQRRLRIILILGATGIALMGWLWISSSSTSDKIDDLAKTNDAQQVLIDKLATQLDEARAQGAAVPAPEVLAADTPGAEVSPVVAPVPGAPGERGDAGPPGESGAAGVGTQGDTGPIGPQGSTGSAGSKGDVGDTGATGQTGDTGDTGSTGATGIPGPAGSQGDPGPAGPQGDPGVAGPAGPPGPTGGMPVTYHFTFNGVAYTCTQVAVGSTTYDCTID